MGNYRRREALLIYITLALDLICISGSYLITSFIKSNLINFNNLYLNILLILALSYSVITELGSKNGNILMRGPLLEVVSVIKSLLYQLVIILVYLFITKQGYSFSRIFLTIFLFINFFLMYAVRSYMKLFVLNAFKNTSSSCRMVLVTISTEADGIVEKLQKDYGWERYVPSMVILDKDMKGESIKGVDVISNKEDFLEYARKSIIDEVLIDIPNDYKEIDLSNIILELENMGIVVHVVINFSKDISMRKKVVNIVAGYNVITFNIDSVQFWKRILKRIIDIVAGLFGSIFTLLLALVLGPIIKMESKGPIFFTQKRVGKNGRVFKIYKFRSMTKDAEEKKKDLLAKNEVDGLMFKIKDDPRITKIGKFIRKTSLDEFPQFFNVLIGNMSLVGTRPPTKDEFYKYESHHKRRLSLKPGITGLWQVNGRSEIKNFEEVVKMDLEYIDNWKISLDFKIILKTIVILFSHKGAV